ncbi:hypothetical protein CRUP_024835 [Coryphaenoides rupestris]|nr:hypothetical protein CRUP_024835 [Coryphaenoides rupestris]
MEPSFDGCRGDQSPPVESGLRGHPIGLSRGAGPKQLLGNAGRREVTAAICRALQPHKVMFLTRSGGLRNEQHKVLGSVSVPADLPGLVSAPWLQPEERKRVETIARLLNHLPRESSAVITSACTLLTDYSAVAIITREAVSSGTPYLDKFVVSSSLQGHGTGHLLWDCIRQDLGQLFWRSRACNKINPCFINGVWTVFWFGLTDIRDSYELVEYARRLPDSFTAGQSDSRVPPPPPPHSAPPTGKRETSG